MTPLLRMALVAAFLVAVGAAVAALGGHLSPAGVTSGLWSGLAGAAAVLLWGFSALALARRRLQRGARPPRGEEAPAATTIIGLEGGGETDDVALIFDGAAAADEPPGLGPPGEAERQAAAILDQIERISRPSGTATVRRAGPSGRWWARWLGR